MNPIDVMDPTVEYEESMEDLLQTFPNATVRRYAVDIMRAQVTRASFDRATIAEELVAAGIPLSPARDIVDAMRAQFKPGNVGVYWDIENMSISSDSTASVIRRLRERLLTNFGTILEFKAYLDLRNELSYSEKMRVALQDFGVQIVDACHNHRKEVADKLIIVDALLFALTHENPTVCIISSDSDFSPLLAKLKMRGIRTVVISDGDDVRSLREQGAASFSFEGLSKPSKARRNEVVPRATAPPPLYSADPVRLDPIGTPNATPTAAGTVTPPPAASGSKVLNLTKKVGPATGAAPPPAALPDISAAAGNGKVSPTKASTSPSFSQMAAKEAAPFASLSIGVQDLLNCIRQVQLLAGSKKVLRSRVGIIMKGLNPVDDLRALVASAEASGYVQSGGQDGGKWLALRGDKITEEDEDLVGPLPHGSTVGHVTGPHFVTGGKNKWYLNLRYATHFHDAFETLQRFKDSSYKVRRCPDPKAPGYYRLGVGEFDSEQDAQIYFQHHFAELGVVPRFTTGGCLVTA